MTNDRLNVKFDYPESIDNSKNGSIPCYKMLEVQVRIASLFQKCNMKARNVVLSRGNKYIHICKFLETKGNTGQLFWQTMNVNKNSIYTLNDSKNRYFALENYTCEGILHRDRVKGIDFVTNDYLPNGMRIQLNDNKGNIKDGSKVEFEIKKSRIDIIYAKFIRVIK